MGEYEQALDDFDHGEAINPKQWKEDVVFGLLYQADVHARLGNETAALSYCARLPDDFWTQGLRALPAAARSTSPTNYAASRPTQDRQLKPHVMSNVLDAPVLSTASKRWQKVARIIAQVSDGVGDGTNSDAMATRIQALVDDGKLQAKDDLSRWRYSEIRRTQSISAE